jgi:hypothetical protein
MEADLPNAALLFGSILYSFREGECCCYNKRVYAVYDVDRNIVVLGDGRYDVWVAKVKVKNCRVCSATRA